MEVEGKLAELEREIEALKASLANHGGQHEFSGGDTVRLGIRSAGTQLNKQRTLNVLAPLTAVEDSANKEIELDLDTSGLAPSDADYLVGTTNSGLSAEIVVGTSPGGELGGTWASPTVDTTHSGTSHAGVVSTHEAAADPHTGYRLESADHSHLTTGAQAGQITHPSLSDYTVPTTWTPVDSSGAALSLTVNGAKYMKFGRLIIAWAVITYPSTADTSATIIGGFPVATANDVAVVNGVLSYTNETTCSFFAMEQNSATGRFYTNAGAAITNDVMSTNQVDFIAIYFTA